MTRESSEDDVKSLDTMLTKGKVSFPFDNGWYLNAFYAANGCTIFGDGTDKAAGYDFSGDKGTAVTNYIVDLFANPNFVMDNNEDHLVLLDLKMVLSTLTSMVTGTMTKLKRHLVRRTLVLQLFLQSILVEKTAS